ncbi:MAG: hypothetical protein IKY09_02750 [Methanocorpusculum sp.]|nr:hypothetical protein [Methanocorpusculum sp.]MBR5450169.1 hypothetical protein [Methanocorpusculum sp.]
MKLLTGLFRSARKRVMTTDNDLGQFRAKLEELVSAKDSLSDEDVVKRVDELKEMTIDLPDEEEKAKLDRFLEDFKTVKEQDEATAKEAAGMVADLFEKLDTVAMKDAPDVGEETSETVEEKTEEEVPLADGDEATEEVKETVEETVAPEGEETKDADGPFDEYTLEEIYQYVKKRMDEDLGATDGCATDGAEEVEKKEEEKEEVVTDHAPRIPVTMNNTPSNGSFLEVFNKIKEGGR